MRMYMKSLYITIVCIVTVQLFVGCGGSKYGDFDSERVYQAADSLASEKALEYYLNGSIFEEANELYQAAIQYQLANMYDPNSATIIMSLSRIYSLINEPEAAVATLEKGWLAIPDDEDLTRTLVHVYLRRRDYEHVINVYSTIAELRDLTEAELNTKAAVFASLSRWDEALKCYENLLIKFQPAPEIYDKIARIHVAQNDIRAAEIALKRLLELDTDNNRVLYLLGGFALERKEWKQAEDYYRQAIDLDSLQMTYWRNFILSIGQQGDLDKQLNAANRASNAFPDIPQFHDIIAGTFQSLGQFEEAVIAANNSIQLDSTRVSPHLTKAFIFHQRERWAQAADSYQAALRINPESALVLNNYAYMLALQNSDLDNAMQMVEKAIVIEPENPSFLDTKAWLLYRLAKYDDALEQIELALDFGTENAEIMTHLASIYEAVGKEELAKKARARAAELEGIEDK